MLSMARIGGPGRAIMATVLIAFATAACGGAASAPGGFAAGPGASAAPAAPAQPAASQAGGGGGEQSGNGNNDGDGLGAEAVDQFTQPGNLLIKTGTLSMQVDKIDPAVADASVKIAALGGYVAGSERSGDGTAEQASITFRIPAARWDDALVTLRGLATKIVNEHTSSDDVTGQVVDLGARIKNLQATEAAVQAIMDRATGIDDVLTVQAELTKIRGQIEELAAQKSGLEGQAAYSTLTVTFSLKPKAEPTPAILVEDQWDAGEQINSASASLVGVLQALATAGIWFGIVWLPILLMIGLIVGIGVSIYRRYSSGPGGGPGDAPVMPAPTGEG
jgi:hypothetical protein